MYFLLKLSFLKKENQKFPFERKVIGQCNQTITFILLLWSVKDQPCLPLSIKITCHLVCKIGSFIMIHSNFSILINLHKKEGFILVLHTQHSNTFGMVLHHSRIHFCIRNPVCIKDLLRLSK